MLQLSNGSILVACLFGIGNKRLNEMCADYRVSFKKKGLIPYIYPENNAHVMSRNSKLSSKSREITVEVTEVGDTV